MFFYFAKRRQCLSIARALTLQTFDVVCTSIFLEQTLKLVTVIRFPLLEIIWCRRCFFLSWLLIPLRHCSSSLRLFSCVDRSVAEGHHGLSSESNLSIDELPFRYRFLSIATLECFAFLFCFFFINFDWSFS